MTFEMTHVLDSGDPAAMQRLLDAMADGKRFMIVETKIQAHSHMYVDVILQEVPDANSSTKS